MVTDGRGFEKAWTTIRAGHCICGDTPPCFQRWADVPTSTIEVNRPPEMAFAYVIDPVRFAEWQEGVVSGYMEGGETPAVGDKCLMTRRIGFAQRVVTSEITHVDPPRTWGLRGIDGPIRATVDVRVEGLDSGRRSRVSIDINFEGRGIGKLIVPLVIRPQAAKEMPANLERLKQRLERLD
jgi:carbon monoxide dehydrogenase subunit G